MNKDLIYVIIAAIVLLAFLVLVSLIWCMISYIKSLGNQIEDVKCKLSQCTEEDIALLHEIIELYDEVCDIRNDIAYHSCVEIVKNNLQSDRKLVDGIGNTTLQQNSCTLDLADVENLGSKVEQDK